MGKLTRRNFLGQGAVAAAGGTIALGVSCSRPWERYGKFPNQETISLCGTWEFHLDPESRGESLGWPNGIRTAQPWTQVLVPHTWQTAEETSGYMGKAWYRREIDVLPAWRDGTVRVEFEAVFHTAHVWVNGRAAGEHIGKGYTPFTCDITKLLVPSQKNTLVVRADNDFSSIALPRNNSYDWTPDGGITRPVNLILTPSLYIEDASVDSWPDGDKKTATLAVHATVCNASDRKATLTVGLRVIDESTGLTAFENAAALEISLPPQSPRDLELPDASFADPRLWHFDYPHLYILEIWISENGNPIHGLRRTFGIRRIEVHGPEFLLNGEPVRLMGVERMAGSHPSYGMAEPASWIEHDHGDLKNLNCVFTRVHWQQDRRVLDYCDRNGILIQVEIPTWGGDTFKGMLEKPSDAIMTNGLEQLREMVRRDRNHPCLFSWGLCNEVDGQSPPAREFVRQLHREAKRLDPRRLCSYASNSLQTTPENDVAGEMDFIEWNEYYETWYGGTPETMRRNLEAIHRAFPDKPIVISEYGYCACTEDRPENDARRIEILRNHNRVFREYPWVGGLIFFCYNDYRTHLGDKGLGILKQRLHGVVDILGAKKPSYEVLRAESSPVLNLKVQNTAGRMTAAVTVREDIPAYTLRGYRLRWVGYGLGNVPLEQGDVVLPELMPGDKTEVSFEPKGPAFFRTRIDIVRPTGFSVATLIIV
jgi:beta-glucuronidase